jgi:hypothetical protein
MKNWQTFITVSLALLCLRAVVNANESHFYTAYKLTSGITIDGELGDRAWATLPEATGFRRLDTTKWSGKQTFFRLGWDAEALYIAVRCDEPDIAKIKAVQKDGGAIWQDDSLEIFMAARHPYFAQFAVNSIGSRIWVWGGDNWQAAAAQQASAWTAEVRITFAELGKSPADSDTWRFNIVRNITVPAFSNGKHATWSPLEKGFHNTDNFATLRFATQALSPAAANRAAAASNRKVLESSVKALDVLIASCRVELDQYRQDRPERADEKSTGIAQGIADLETTAAAASTLGKLEAARRTGIALRREILEMRFARP